VKPARFRYIRPDTLDAAIEALDGLPGARVLAGGQSLVPIMNQRHARPSALVDITRLTGLSDVDSGGRRLRVGALVTQSAFEDVPSLARRCPLVHDCLPFTGHLATRNRGTVGGSIAHADPRAELPLALLTLGGSAEAAGSGGRRTIAAEDLFVGAYESALERDEIIVATVWPTADELAGQAFEEIAQRHGDYTIAAAACALRVADGRVAAARIGVGAVGDRPLLIPAAAAALVDRAVDERTAEEAGRLAADAIAEPLEDIHGSARYRRQLVRVLVARTARRAWQRAREAAT
jgi:aerobic carbon-monoxide dehydrogenase medium subunit